MIAPKDAHTNPAKQVASPLQAGRSARPSVASLRYRNLRSQLKSQSGLIQIDILFAKPIFFMLTCSQNGEQGFQTESVQ
jgi:hypothetical protein